MYEVCNRLLAGLPKWIMDSLDGMEGYFHDISQRKVRALYHLIIDQIRDRYGYQSELFNLLCYAMTGNYIPCGYDYIRYLRDFDYRGFDAAFDFVVILSMYVSDRINIETVDKILADLHRNFESALPGDDGRKRQDSMFRRYLPDGRTMYVADPSHVLEFYRHRE